MQRLVFPSLELPMAAETRPPPNTSSQEGKLYAKHGKLQPSHPSSFWIIHEHSLNMYEFIEDSVCMFLYAFQISLRSTQASHHQSWLLEADTLTAIRIQRVPLQRLVDSLIHLRHTWCPRALYCLRPWLRDFATSLGPSLCCKNNSCSAGDQSDCRQCHQHRPYCTASHQHHQRMERQLGTARQPQTSKWQPIWHDNCNNRGHTETFVKNRPGCDGCDGLASAPNIFTLALHEVKDKR